MTAAIQSMPPVIQPTWRGGLSFVDYALLPAINWSTLKEMARSPLHYAHRLTTPRDDTSSLALGRAVHTCILEPERWNADYTVYPGKTRRGKEWDAFKAAHEGMTILTKDQAHDALAIKRAVFANKTAARYLENGWSELTLTWGDPVTGFPCKARIDRYAEVDGKRYIVDVKTARDVGARAFGGVAARYGYHGQLAWYTRGAKANGLRIDGHKIIAVESDAPHDVAVFDVDEDTIYAGEEECAQLVERVRACFIANDWRGQYDGEEPLQMPAWWYADDVDADELGLTNLKSANNNDDEGEV